MNDCCQCYHGFLVDKGPNGEDEICNCPCHQRNVDVRQLMNTIFTPSTSERIADKLINQGGIGAIKETANERTTCPAE